MAKKKHESKLNLDSVNEEAIEEKIKKYKVKINNVENNAIIFTLSGYSKRIYFDLPFKELEYLRDNKNSYKNKILNIYYIGDISDVFSVKILPLKNLKDIGDRL